MVQFKPNYYQYAKIFLIGLTLLLGAKFPSPDSFLVFAADTTLPASILDLTAEIITTDSITFNWTAPGDDGFVGPATAYDMRKSLSNFTASQWTSLTQITNTPFPSQPGIQETFKVTGLNPNTQYYFAIRGIDEIGNLSLKYNTVKVTTLALNVTPFDPTPPFRPIGLQVK